MEIKFLTQPKEGKLGDIIKNRLKEGYAEVHIIAGMAKDTGFEEILAEIESASSLSNINCYIGVDRKNTSKDMLSKLLSLGVKLHIHINTDTSKVESRIYIFESEKANSYIYTSGGKFSSSGIFESISTITEIKFDTSDASDESAFKISKNSILQGTNNIFHSIDQEEIILLAEKGEISARITERKIPKISEIYGVNQSSGENSDNSQLLGERIYDESTSSSTIDLNSLEDIDIDFEPEIAVRMNVQLEAEKEAKKEQKEKEELLKNLKKNANDLDKFYDNKFQSDEKKKPTIRMSDELDYQNMTTLILECNKIIEKGSGAGEFKIPKALAENLSNFLGTESATFDSFEVFDNISGVSKTDSEAKLIITSKGTSIKSDVLNAFHPEEGDIIRLLKEDNHKYRCEIIREKSPEYDVWQCYCVNTLKGNKRKFGII
ncbi:MAG: hypothetical protein IJ215_02325 [Clostridia bacterium]|nr:hypothetical protein [Clostridia bacterium]